MRIGELAAQTGVSVRAIRHYDRLGLLISQRGENRYRLFTADDILRVNLIRLFLSVGFRLEEIRDYAPCWQAEFSPAGAVPAEQAAAFYRRKLTELEAQIADLQAVRNRLQEQLLTLEDTHETATDPERHPAPELRRTRTAD